MGKRQLVANRQYTDEFKIEAVRLAESIGGTAAAKRLGTPQSSMWNWILLSRKGKLSRQLAGAVPVKRRVTELETENSRLRRELANAQADLEIVKKAAAYFAKESR